MHTAFLAEGWGAVPRASVVFHPRLCCLRLALSHVWVSYHVCHRQAVLPTHLHPLNTFQAAFDQNKFVGVGFIVFDFILICCVRIAVGFFLLLSLKHMAAIVLLLHRDIHAPCTIRRLN